MTEKKCICRNVGVCSLANNEDIQTIVGDDIVELYCLECGEIAEEYIEIQEKPKRKGAKRMIMAIAGTMLLVGLGLTANFILFPKPSHESVLASAEATSRIIEAPPINEPVQVNIESMTLDTPTLELVVGQSEQLTFTLSPQGADASQLQWVARDATVATVEDGIVTAVAEGMSMIVVGSKDKVLAKCKVEVKKKEVNEDTVSKPQTNKIASGTWTGGSKNNKPHGSNITFTFTSSNLIDKRDPKQRIAGVGDYIIGEFVDGHLVHGRWYKKAGGFESIIIGQP